MPAVENAKVIAHYCLKVEPRVYDVLSIILISAGINVVTGAGGATGVLAKAIALLSGLALAGCGVLMTFLKSNSEAVLQTVRLASKNDEDKVRRWANQEGESISSKPPTGMVRTKDELYELAMYSFLDYRKSALSIARRLVFLLLLFCLGSIGAVWSLAQEDERTTQGAESLTKSYQQDVRNQIEDLRHQVAILLTVVTSTSEALTTIEEATSAGNQKLTEELGQMRLQLTALSKAITRHRISGGRGSKIATQTQPTNN